MLSTIVMALVLTASLMAGFAVAKLRADGVKAPVAGADAGAQWVEAWVGDVASPGEGGQRLLLAPIRVGDWPTAATPIRGRPTRSSWTRGTAIRPRVTGWCGAGWTPGCATRSC